jgi:hypothetical protein
MPGAFLGRIHPGPWARGLTERRSRAAAGHVAVDRTDRFLSRLPGGGFVLEADGESPIRVASDKEGWRVEVPEELEGWCLRRSDAEGFVLSRPTDGSELGITMPLVGAGAAAGLRYLLLDDGRLFRLVLCGPRDARYELMGWETPGSYITARPRPQGWSLTPNPACSGLRDIRALTLLMAAEILDAEQPQRPGEPGDRAQRKEP